MKIMSRPMLFLLLVLCPLLAFADPYDPECKGDPDRRFSPEEFMRRSEAFITAEAKLTPAESAKFFPLFREMKEKQRRLMMEKGKLLHAAAKDNQSEADCLKALNKIEDIEEDIVEIGENYQKRFLKRIPASKLVKVLIAEQRFERRMLRNMAKPPKCPPGDRQKQKN